MKTRKNGLSQALSITAIALGSASFLGSCALWYKVFPYPVSKVDSDVYINSVGDLFRLSDDYILATGRLDARYGVIDVSDPKATAWLYKDDETFGVGDIAANGTIGYIVDNSRGLSVIDFSGLPGQHIALLSTVENGIVQLEASRSFLYAASATEIIAYGLSDPRVPNEIQRLPFNADGAAIQIGAMALGRDRLFIIEGGYGQATYRTFAVGQDGNLEAGRPKTFQDYQARPAAIVGSFALTSMGGNAFISVDLSDIDDPKPSEPIDPRVEGDGFDMEDSFGLSKIEIAGTKAVVYGEDYICLSIFDVSNPAAPAFMFPTLSQRVNILPAGAQDGMCVAGNYVYIAYYQQNLHVYRMP